MSQFEELLSQLKSTAEEQETLAKALPVKDGEDDEAIQAAATEGADANPEDDESDEDEAGADEKAPMAKSVVAMIDGEEVEAIDATEMIKSLMERADKTDDVLAKALASTVTTIRAQGEMIKSMSAKLEKLSGQGAGRKTVLTVIEKPPVGETMTKSHQDEGMTPAGFMAKANAAFTAGKLTGKELTTIDVAIRTGQASVLDQSLIAKALS